MYLERKRGKRIFSRARGKEDLTQSKPIMLSTMESKNIKAGSILEIT